MCVSWRFWNSILKYLDGNLFLAPFDREVESDCHFVAWSLVRHFCETTWGWLSLPLELSETFVWADKFNLELVRHLCELTLLNWHSKDLDGNLFPVPFDREVESDGRFAAWSLMRHLCETRWGWLSLPLELSETFVWADKFKLGIRETFVWADAFELAFWYLDGNLCPVPFDREVESGGRFAAWSLVRHFCEARWEWLSLPLELSEKFVWADKFNLELVRHLCELTLLNWHSEIFGWKFVSCRFWACLRRVLEKIVVEECWGRVLEGSVGEECCREVLWRSVVEKSLGEGCCREVL